VIDENPHPVPSQVRRVTLCCGKIYYDLIAKRDLDRMKNIAIVRVEQLYPFPADTIQSILAGYPAATEIVWAQEEPKNMGAWSFLEPQLLAILAAGQSLRYAGRKASASTATGSLKIHQEEQAGIVMSALT